MAWEGSNRRAELPPDWPAIRKRILDRDSYRCRWIQDGKRCTERATDVDHRGDKHNHDDDNLRALCAPHHRRRTGQQAAAARPSIRRPAERHPGLI